VVSPSFAASVILIDEPSLMSGLGGKVVSLQ
jgi:hypothetical protein